MSGNTANQYGGGIVNSVQGTIILNGLPSVSGNTADADDADGGTGGGIFVGCFTTLTGAVDGGNVNDNYRGTASPVENNIVLESC